MMSGMVGITPRLEEGRILGWWFLREYVDGGTCQFPALKRFGYRFSVRYSSTGGVYQKRSFGHKGQGSLVDHVVRFLSAGAM